jgi:hypothetical protein
MALSENADGPDLGDTAEEIRRFLPGAPIFPMARGAAAPAGLIALLRDLA